MTWFAPEYRLYLSTQTKHYVCTLLSCQENNFKIIKKICTREITDSGIFTDCCVLRPTLIRWLLRDLDVVTGYALLMIKLYACWQHKHRHLDCTLPCIWRNLCVIPASGTHPLTAFFFYHSRHHMVISVAHKFCLTTASLHPLPYDTMIPLIYASP